MNFCNQYLLCLYKSSYILLGTIRNLNNRARQYLLTTAFEYKTNNFPEDHTDNQVTERPEK